MKISVRPLLYLLLCTQTGAADQPTAPVAGQVIDVQRRCEVRKSLTAPAVRVSIGKLLQAGDRVNCVRSGSLTYLALQSLTPVRVAIVPPGFHMVLNTPLKAPDADESRGGRGASSGQPATDGQTPRQLVASVPDDAMVGSVIGGLLSGVGWTAPVIAKKAGFEECQANPTTLIISAPTSGDDSQASRAVKWMRHFAQNQRCIEIVTEQALALIDEHAMLKRDQVVELTVAPLNSDTVQLILKRYGQEHPIASTLRTLNSRSGTLVLDTQDQQDLSEDLEFLMRQNDSSKGQGAH